MLRDPTPLVPAQWAHLRPLECTVGMAMQMILSGVRDRLRWPGLRMVGTCAGTQTAVAIALAVTIGWYQLLNGDLPAPLLESLVLFAPAMPPEMLEKHAPAISKATLIVFCDADSLCPTADPVRFAERLRNLGSTVIRIKVPKHLLETARTFIGTACHNLSAVFSTQQLRALAAGRGFDGFIQDFVVRSDMFRHNNPVRAALSALFLSNVARTSAGRDNGVLTIVGERAEAVSYMQPLGKLGLATFRFLLADADRH